MNPGSELPGPPAPEECDPELVAAYTVGEVGPELRDQIAAHLLDCNRCWEQLRISRAVTSAVQQLWEPAPPALKADLRTAILDAGESGGRAARRPTARANHMGRGEGRAALGAGPRPGQAGDVVLWSGTEAPSRSAASGVESTATFVPARGGLPTPISVAVKVTRGRIPKSICATASA
mgnify:CR=1 FL=1